MGSRARPSSPARAPSPARVEEALDRTVAAELPRLLPRQRWFGSKGRAIAAVRAADWARLGERGWLGLVDVAFGAGADERYLVAFVLRAGAAPRGALSLPLDLAETSVRAEDAFDDPLFCRALLEGFGRGTSVSSTRGRLRFVRGDGAPTLAQAAALVPRRLSVEQSNTSVVYGDRFVLKALRRIEPGRSLDYEVGAFLTSRVGFAHVPQVAGAIEYVPAAGPAATLAILQRYVPNHGDGWAWLGEHLRRLGPAGAGAPEMVAELRRLGALTGGLHTALASDAADPAFCPSPSATKANILPLMRETAVMGMVGDLRSDQITRACTLWSLRNFMPSLGTLALSSSACVAGSTCGEIKKTRVRTAGWFWSFTMSTGMPTRTAADFSAGTYI